MFVSEQNAKNSLSMRFPQTVNNTLFHELNPTSRLMLNFIMDIGIIMLPQSWSCSLYPVTVMDAISHRTKKNTDYFSFQPRFGYIDLNARKLKMAAL